MKYCVFWRNALYPESNHSWWNGKKWLPHPSDIAWYSLDKAIRIAYNQREQYSRHGSVYEFEVLNDKNEVVWTTYL